MKLRIGEVAKRTGLTIRTLRHYDALGLLAPTERSGAAYRLYSSADLAHLLQIQSLKTLGLSLRDIERALDDPAYDTQEVLRQHIGLLERRIQQEQELLARLCALQGVAEVGWMGIADVIHLTEQVDGRVRQFMTVARDVAERDETMFSREQWAYLRARHTPNWTTGGEDWPQLLTDVLSTLERGTPPDTPEAKELARRWNALVHQFTGGRSDIAHALDAAYQQHLPPELKTVWTFIASAMNHLTTGEPMTTEHPPTTTADLLHADKNVRIRAALNLGAERRLDALPDLVERLTCEPDFFVRENLTWAVVRMAEEALPSLVALLKHPNASARLQVVHTLSKIADPRATDALLQVLDDPDAEVARRAIFALGRINSPQALTALGAGLGDVDAERRSTLSTAIQGFGSAALIPLTRSLQHEQTGVRAHAADILGLIGHADAIPTLARALKDSEWDVRFAALSALGQLPDPQAENAIREAINDADSRIRAVAVRLLKDRQVG